MLHTPANAYRPFIIMTYTTHTVHVAARHTGIPSTAAALANPAGMTPHHSPTSWLWLQFLNPSAVREQASKVLSPP